MGTGHFCRSLHVAMQFGLSLIQSTRLDSGVQSLRILEGIFESFLLIICTRRIVTRIFNRVARDAQTFQHMAGFY